MFEMPRAPRSARSETYYRHSPVTTPTSATYPTLSARQPASSLQNTYYADLPPTMHQPTYTHLQTTYATGGPVQLPQQHYPVMPVSNPQPQPSLPPAVSIRASSGAWSPEDDARLMTARAQGMNWGPLQQAHFPTKTGNACRKRWERLMERQKADDWDTVKLETLAQVYVKKREEMWKPLALATGEKWTVIEQKCMAHGLKNLQNLARSATKRERMLGAYGPEDSGIDINEDLLEAGGDYDAGDGASPHSVGSGALYQTSYYPTGNEHHHRQSSNGGGGYLQHQQHHGGQRIPSTDMGISAIINRPNGGHQGR